MSDLGFKFGPFIESSLVIEDLRDTDANSLTIFSPKSSAQKKFISKLEDEILTTVDHAKNDKWTLDLDYIFESIISSLFTKHDYKLALASVIHNAVKKHTKKSPIVVISSTGWSIHFEAVYFNEKGDLVVTDPTSAKANEYEFVGFL